MDLGKDAADRQAAVAGESVAHTAARCHDRGGREKHAYDREHQQADSSGLAACCIVQDLEKGSSRGSDGVVDILEHKQQAHQEDEAREHSDDDTDQHDPGTFDLWPWDLLDHVDDRIESRQGKGTLQETKEPRQSIRPTTLVDETAEDEGGALVVGSSASKDGDTDDCETGE